VSLPQWVWFSEFLPRTCSTQCPQEVKIQIFEIFKLGWSLYWIGILKQFLLGQEVVFCFRAILNLGLSYVSDSNFGQFLSMVGKKNWGVKNRL
jgi:hypothetical protein